MNKIYIALGITVAILYLSIPSSIEAIFFQ